MFVKNNSLRIILPVLVLSLVSLACQINLGGPTIPENSAPPASAEDAQNFENSIKTTFENAGENEPVSFSITQEQMTYYVAQKIGETPASFISNPQVFLRNGQIELYGEAVNGSLTGNVMIVLHAVVDENGVPSVQLVTADFGPLPVPDGLMDGFSAMMNEALTGSIGSTASGFKLEDISIEDGVMTITGISTRPTSQ